MYLFIVWYPKMHWAMMSLVLFNFTLKFEFYCNSHNFIEDTGLGGSVGCASDWWSGGCGFKPHQVDNILSWIFDHEIFSTVILSLPLIQEGQLSVSCERMRTILVNSLEDLACPVKVWLGKLPGGKLSTPDMTPLGWPHWALKPQHKKKKKKKFQDCKF